MTKEENLLWYRFLRMYPLQFRRQYQIGPYIVDFYCYKARLIVELDGSQHCEPEALAYDQKRTTFYSNKACVFLEYPTWMCFGTFVPYARTSTTQ